MKESKTAAAYWTVTLLVALPLGALGIAYLIGAEGVRQGMAHLGYPAYFLIILGTAKILGAAALLQDRLATLKEWAYAGFTFNLLGAAASHVFARDPASMAAGPLVLLVLLAASYILNGKRTGAARLRRAAAQSSVQG